MVGRNFLALAGNFFQRHRLGVVAGSGGNASGAFFIRQLAEKPDAEIVNAKHKLLEHFCSDDYLDLTTLVAACESTAKAARTVSRHRAITL